MRRRQESIDGQHAREFCKETVVGPVLVLFLNAATLQVLIWS